MADWKFSQFSCGETANPETAGPVPQGKDMVPGAMGVLDDGSVVSAGRTPEGRIFGDHVQGGPDGNWQRLMPNGSVQIENRNMARAAPSATEMNKGFTQMLDACAPRLKGPGV